MPPRSIWPAPSATSSASTQEAARPARCPASEREGRYTAGMASDVAVIGAGVIGLTSGIELLMSGHDVTIYARERAKGTTSAVPAAIWFPYHARPEEDVKRWALVTRERLRLLENQPATGVHWVDFSRVWVDAPPPVEHWAKPDEVTWL